MHTHPLRRQAFSELVGLPMDRHLVAWPSRPARTGGYPRRITLPREVMVVSQFAVDSAEELARTQPHTGALAQVSMRYQGAGWYVDRTNGDASRLPAEYNIPFRAWRLPRTLRRADVTVFGTTVTTSLSRLIPTDPKGHDTSIAPLPWWHREVLFPEASSHYLLRTPEGLCLAIRNTLRDKALGYFTCSAAMEHSLHAVDESRLTPAEKHIKAARILSSALKGLFKIYANTTPDDATLGRVRSSLVGSNNFS